MNAGVSAIVMHELLFGAYKSQRAARNLNVADELRFVVVEFDQDDKRQAGAVQAALAITGRPIDLYGVLSAGQAQAWDLILVTLNTGQFSWVCGLRIEDWDA